MNPTLVILAAGMGSRYGGMKQIDGVGSHGKPIHVMDGATSQLVIYNKIWDNANKGIALSYTGKYFEYYLGHKYILLKNSDKEYTQYHCFLSLVYLRIT